MLTRAEVSLCSFCVPTHVITLFFRANAWDMLRKTSHGMICHIRVNSIALLIATIGTHKVMQT